MSQSTFIPLNRKKMMLKAVLYFLAGLVVFSLIYYGGEKQDYVNTNVTKVLSVVVFGFFGIVGATFLKNARDQNAGLYIDHKGIDDQTTNIGIGMIPWKEIKAAQFKKEGRHYKLLFFVKKPEKVIEGGMNKAVQRLLERNKEDYQTPVVIDLSILITNKDEVMDALNEFSKQLEIRG